MSDPPPMAPSVGAGRYALGVLLVIVALGIGIVSLLRDSRDAGEAVRTAFAVRRSVTQKVLAQGKVRARTQVEVASEIGGRVSAVHVDIGDVVKQGDALFALDDEQLKNAVEQLRVALSAAEAVQRRAMLAAAEADRGIDRDGRLHKSGVVAEEQLKLSESRAHMARAELDQARAGIERTRLDLQRARDALRRAKVTAPSNGTIVAVGVEVGQVVSAVQGLASGDGLVGLSTANVSSAPVVIADLAELIVRLDVDELDIGLVKLGQRALVHAQGIKDLAFDGVVERVGLMGRDQAGAVLFVVEVAMKDVGRAALAPPRGGLPPGLASAACADAGDSPTAKAAMDRGWLSARAAVSRCAPGGTDGGLRPGMSAQADIEVLHIADVIAIPVAAVLEGDGADMPDRVFVYDGDAIGGRVHERSVKLGPTEGDSIAILSGLDNGAVVVLGPFRALKGLADGDRVSIEVKKTSDDPPQKQGS